MTRLAAVGRILCATTLVVGLTGAVRAEDKPAEVEELPPSATMLAGTLMLPLRNHSPVPISGILAQALGTSAATFDQLVKAALHDENSQVRDAAAKVCIQTIEADPTLTQSVQSVVGGMDDQALTVAAQHLGGPNVEQFVRAIATNANEPDIRSRAAAVIEQLHSQGKAAGS